MNLLDGGADGWFHGALGTSIEDGAVSPRRLTARQLALFDRSEGLRLRARCSAGTALALRTDSPFLELELDVLGGARTYLGLDLEVDGVRAGGVRLDPAGDTWAGRFELAGAGLRGVRLFLPVCRRVRIRRVGLAPGARVAPLPPPALKLLCLGDSITQGMDALSPACSYPAQLALLLGAELLNQGVGGHVFEPAAFDEELPFAADVVTVAYGTNDWSSGRDADGVRAVAGAYLAKVRRRYPEAMIAAVGPLWRANGAQVLAGGDLAAFSRAILAAAAEVDGIVAVDGSGLVPHQPWCFADGVHPNDLGAVHCAAHLYRALRLARGRALDAREAPTPASAASAPA